jgi:hypothetical protein
MMTHCPRCGDPKSILDDKPCFACQFADWEKEHPVEAAERRRKAEERQ